MRAGFMIGCLLFSGMAQAAPVTVDYIMSCSQFCDAYGAGDAHISLTYDNSGFTKWSRNFIDTPIIDFSIRAGSFKTNYSEMKGSTLGVMWGNKPNGNAAFSLWASENNSDTPLLPAKTVNVFHQFFGGDFAELGMSGSMNSMGDYAVYDKPAPIPLPAPGLLLGAMVLLAITASQIRRRGQLVTATA